MDGSQEERPVFERQELERPVFERQELERLGNAKYFIPLILICISLYQLVICG